MTKNVTFGQVHRLLDGMGFVRKPVEGKHVVFEHKPTDTLLFFRPHRLNERVDAMTLSIVQKTLDLNGFLESDQFEDALRRASANGAPKTRRK